MSIHAETMASAMKTPIKQEGISLRASKLCCPCHIKHALCAVKSPLLALAVHLKLCAAATDYLTLD